MRFEHSLRFNAVPDWTQHYMGYPNLKKLIYALERSAHRQTLPDAESRPLVSHGEPPEVVFKRALDVELEKVSSFFASKEGELNEELSQLFRDADNFDEEAATQLEAARNTTNYEHRRHRAGSVSSAQSGDGNAEDDSDNDHDSDDETTGLNRSRSSLTGRRRRNSAANPMMSSIHTTTDLTASTDFSRAANMNQFNERSFLYSTAIMLKKRIVTLYVQFCELKSFVQLNYDGFRKVLKKFDKILFTSIRDEYMTSSVQSTYCFSPDAMKGLYTHIQRLEQVYADIITNGDLAAARKHLRSHLREHVVWERNTVWRDMIGLERRAEAATLGTGLLGNVNGSRRLQGDDKPTTTTTVRTPFGMFEVPFWVVSTKVINLLIAIVFFWVITVFLSFEQPQEQNALAILAFATVCWATECIPLWVTAFVIFLLADMMGVIMSSDDTERLAPKDAAPLIWGWIWGSVLQLLLGGFTIAAALSKYAIDKRLATFVLSKAGTKPRNVLLANMFVSAFFSMLISNVAAPVLCNSTNDPLLRTLPSTSNMSKALLLGIALSANIGGMLSPIASPQNVVAMGIMDPAPSWGQWLLVVIPVGVLSILAIWLLLLVTFQPDKDAVITPMRSTDEKFNGKQWFVIAVTAVTIALWCTSKNIEPWLGDMGIISIIPMIIFFGSGILTKEDFNSFPWHIVFLASGGSVLGKVVKSSGLLDAVGRYVSKEVTGMSSYGVLTVFCCLILVVATFISHTVAALITLPLVREVGLKMSNPVPNLLVMGGVLMCSAAMGLPTSGFPNITAIMKEDSIGQRYLTTWHFISRGVPSSFMTMGVVLTAGFGLMLTASLD